MSRSSCTPYPQYPSALGTPNTPSIPSTPSTPDVQTMDGLFSLLGENAAETFPVAIVVALFVVAIGAMYHNTNKEWQMRTQGRAPTS